MELEARPWCGDRNARPGSGSMRDRVAYSIPAAVPRKNKALITASTMPYMNTR